MFIVNRIVFVINSLFILALLVSYLAPFVSPELMWPVAFLGLAYPGLVIVNILFIIYWAVFLNMKFLFSLAAIVIGINHIPRFVQFGATKESRDGLLNIVTFNAHYFGVGENRSIEDADLFFDKLARLDPDILCFQEMLNPSHVDTNLIVARMQIRYAKYNRCNIKLSKGKWSADNIGIISRYPIASKGEVEHDPNSGNYTIYADVVIGEDTVRVISTHLQSIKFVKREYDAVKDIKLDSDPEKVGAYKSIVSKMKIAYLMRAKQTDLIAEFIEKSPHKVIVCGDFNDSPLSYAYRTIKGDMKDAFTEAGSGLGRTYVGAMPSFRIDYIFTDPSFSIYNYYARAFDFSDHKLVSCSVKIH